MQEIEKYTDILTKTSSHYTCFLCSHAVPDTSLFNSRHVEQSLYMANLILNPVCIFITTVSIGAVSFHVAALQIWCLVFNFCQNLQTTFLLSNSNFYSFSPQLPPHTHTCTQTHAEAWLWKLDTVCLTVRHQLVPDTRLQPHWLILQTLLHIVIGCCLLRCSDSDPVNLHMNQIGTFSLAVSETHDGCSLTLSGSAAPRGGYSYPPYREKQHHSSPPSLSPSPLIYLSLCLGSYAVLLCFCLCPSEGFEAAPSPLDAWVRPNYLQ